MAPAAWPERMNVMHWHGDTFDLPPGARSVAESAGCPRQAFVFGDRVVGLQFHLEMGAVHVADLAHVSMDELVPAQFVIVRQQLLVHLVEIAAQRRRAERPRRVAVADQAGLEDNIENALGPPSVED